MTATLEPMTGAPPDLPPIDVATAAIPGAESTRRGSLNVRPDQERGGERGITFEIAPTGDGLIAKLLFGRFSQHGDEEQKRRYPVTVAADATPHVESATAACDAALAALPSMIEATRLGAVAAGYQSKVDELTATAARLKEKIVAAAAKGELGKKDRDALAAVTADMEAHEDVLRVARRQLDAAKADLTNETKALAVRQLTAAATQFDASLAEVRDAILADHRLWALFHRLVVSASVNRQVHSRLNAVIDRQSPR